MDAHEQTFKAPRSATWRVAGLATGWLVLLLALGLWQGYGRWLLSRIDAG
jgi:hypothetical protein